jgi:drug/metabolite transporter (DMT)-like permease
VNEHAAAQATAARAHPSLPLIVLVAASCTWGLAWLPLKALAAAGVAGTALVFVASLVASLALAPRFWAERPQWHGRTGGLLAIALLGGYTNLSFTLAAMYGDIVRVMVLFYLLPVWGALGGRIFLGERLDRWRVLATVMALVGAWLVLGGVEAARGAIGWTDVVALTCGMAFAGNNLVFRARQDLPVGSKTAAMVMGGAVLVSLSLVTGLAPWPEVSPAAWTGTVGYGIGWLLIANLATQFGVTHMEAGRASVIIILELVVAVATAMLIGGEHMSALEMAGGALILIAALLEARRGT